jgi:hypothetical protein
MVARPMGRTICPLSWLEGRHFIVGFVHEMERQFVKVWFF